MSRAITPAETRSPTSLPLFEGELPGQRARKPRAVPARRERRWPDNQPGPIATAKEDARSATKANAGLAVAAAANATVAAGLTGEPQASRARQRSVAAQTGKPHPSHDASPSATSTAASQVVATHKVADVDLTPAAVARPPIRLVDETCTSLLRVNDSIDLPYPLSINPYRGCEHGCTFCPVTRGPVGHGQAAGGSAGVAAVGRIGLDSGTAGQGAAATGIEVHAKRNAADRLRLELRRPGYRPRPICLGSAVDAYQPIERRLRLTRGLIEVLAESRHPFGLATRSAGVVRDLDLFEPLAEQGLLLVLVSLATLDAALAARIEPGAPAPAQRLAAIRSLARAGVWVGLNLSPLQPGVNDGELEALAAAAAQAGARALRWRGRLADEHLQADITRRLDQARSDHGLSAELAPLDVSRFIPPAPPATPTQHAPGQKLLF